ncbi:MAG: metal ABC transporter ATP-binding protein [Candidatus Caldarchaeales archaeon]
MVGELTVDGLTVTFDGLKALDNISFKLDSPFLTVVMGPNGAGKTTLLKCIIGMIKPSSGMVKVYGYDSVREYNKIRRFVGYVPQIVNINLHVPVTVREVISMGIISKSVPPRIFNRKIEEEVEDALRLVELEGYSERLFSELSGGERQRVLIARAMVRGARLLLLDEPFSMLDFDIKCEIAGLLSRIHSRMGVDILLVAHEISPCIAYNPLVILLNKKIYAIGRVDEVLRLEILKRAYPGITEVPQGFIIGEDHA